VGVGNGYLTQQLAAWRWDGGNWSSFAATDLSSDGGYADFTVTSPGGYAVATVPLTCTWNAASGNWTDAAKWYPAVPLNGAPAGCSYDAVVNGGVVTLNGEATVRSLAVHGGTVAGAGLLHVSTRGTVTGGALAVARVVNPGTLTFNSPAAIAVASDLSGAGMLVQAGGGITTISGSYAATGPIAVTAGKLVLASTNALRQMPAVLLAMQSLTVSSGATLDVTNHDLMIGNSSLSVIEAAIVKGFNMGGGASDAAITSSTALAAGNAFLVPVDADALLGNGMPGSAIGRVFDGVTISQPGTILVKYAYIGDVTLDGKIDGLDYATAAGHFGQVTPGLGGIARA
jgi:hypothetical protein